MVPLTELPLGAPTEKMPEWLTQKNPARTADVGHESQWLRKTIEKMRKTVEKAIASEEIARSNGFLQSINPLAKAIGFLCLLIASGIARSVWPVTAFVGLVIVLAALSRVPLKAFCSRVVETVLFFGLIVAVPLSLRSVTSGPSEFRILGVDVSSTGLHSSEMILLRLCAGISLAMVWTLTTKWNELLQSLRAIGVPQMFLAAATLTYRYLFVVVEALAEMVEARTSRQVVPNGKNQGRTYAGRGTAILFAKSQAFTEEVHQAMVARSFDRIRRTRINSNWKAIDSIAVCLGVACLAIAVLSGVSRAI